MKKHFILSSCLLLFLGFTACEDDTVPAVEDEENNPPVANAGPDLEASTSSTVQLDGSGSSDPDGDQLTYLWEISTRPEGSTVAITNQTSAVASFIPDVAGSYTLTLTVSDEAESDTDEAIVVVEGEPMETVEVSSNIDEDVVWEDIFENPDVPDYFVTKSIKVNAQLSVQPGVVVHVAEEAIITVESGGGTLIAKGEEDSPITFTSYDEAGEIHWGGILFNSSSSQNALEYVNIAYAGGGQGLMYLGSSKYAVAMLGINESGRLNIRNTNFTNSAGDGLFLLKSGNLPTFSNNTFSEISGYPVSLSVNQLGILDNTNFYGDENAAHNMIRIYDSVLEEDQEWMALDNNTAYLFQGDVRVDAKLSIQEGALLMFDEGVIMEVSSKGVLKATGTTDNKVVFTSSGVADGQKWGGILFKSTSVNNELDHVQVLHGGGKQFIYLGSSQYATGNVGVTEGAKLKLTNSELSHSEGIGLTIWKGNLESFAGNSFHNNEGYPIFVQANMLGMVDEATDISGNKDDVVAVYQSNYDGDAKFSDDDNPQWVKLLGDAQYLFLGNINIEEDLVLAEGARLAFAPEIWMSVSPNGSLKANGSADNKVVLTAYVQDGNNNWGGLVFHSDNSNNHFKHVEVSYGGNFEKLVYAGGGVYLAGNIVVDEGTFTIDNSAITNSSAYGIAVNRDGEANIGENMSYSNNEEDNVFRF